MIAQPWPECEIAAYAQNIAASADVAVVEQHERRLAAELEEHALHGRARRGHDLAADRRRAGERHDVDVGMRRQLGADRGVGRREHVHDAGRDVGRLGDELAERERRPRRVGRALQHDGAAGRERRRELRERELDRVVVRRDRADDAGGFLLDPAVVPARERVALAEVLDEVVALEQIGVPAARRRSGRRAAARSCSRPARRPRCTRISRSGVDVVEQRLVQLAQAPHAERVVARPVGRVERAPGRGDRAPRVVDGRVGGDAEHRLGRRVDVLVRRAARRPAPARRRSAAALRARSS